MRRKIVQKMKSIYQWIFICIIFILIYSGYATISQHHFHPNNIMWGQQSLRRDWNNTPSNRNLNQIAKIDHIKQIPSTNNVTFHIKRQTKIYGLFDELGLVKPQHYYVLHFTYHSQLYPLYAPDACEASALRMALSTKGKAQNISMKKFIRRIPRSTNPKYGYTEDPYFYGDSASIYPHALAQYARKYYHVKVKDISHSTKTEFINQIKHGNPIVFEGAYQMRDTNSDHTLVIIGYRSGHPGQFLIADPFVWKSQHNKVFWTSTSNFMHIYRGSMRGEHALVVQ